MKPDLFLQPFSPAQEFFLKVVSFGAGVHFPAVGGRPVSPGCGQTGCTEKGGLFLFHDLNGLPQAGGEAQLYECFMGQAPGQ